MSLQEMRDLADLAGLEIVEVLSAGLLRVPKLHFSESTLAASDDAAMRHPSLRRFSEDLVAVCVPR